MKLTLLKERVLNIINIRITFINIKLKVYKVKDNIIFKTFKYNKSN
jgi:hypothetical protein